jgi:hypothetical protein
MRYGVLVVALLAAATMCGCSKAGGGGQRNHLGKPGAPPKVLKPARVIYTAGGKLGAAKIAAIAMQPGTKQRYLVLMQWVQQGKKVYEGRYRLIRLDLTSGSTQELGAVDEGGAEPRHIACARNGRIAVEGEDNQINVREPDGAWRTAIHRTDDTLHEPLGWSPDSRSLLCHHVRVATYGYDFTAVTSASSSEPFRERSIAHRFVQNAVWSADGSGFYALAPGRTGTALDLLSVEWPSGRETTLLRGELGDLSVAEEIGTLAFIASAGGDSWEVWTMQPGSKPERTPVVLPSMPTEFEVSPDGTYVAAVLGKQPKSDKGFPLAEGGLAVYRLSDGAEYRVPDTIGKNVMMMHWVLGGRAVVYTVVPRGFLDWESKATGERLWLVNVP